MSQHFMTVCVFCLICATHTPCSAHTEIVDQKILKHYNNGLADPNRINIPNRMKTSDHGTVSSKYKDSPNSNSINDEWIKRPNSFKNVLSDEQITSNNNNNNVNTNITTNTFIKSNEQLIRHKRVKKSTELLDEHYYVRRIFHIFNQTGDLIHLDDFKNLIKRLHLYNMFHENSDSNNKTCIKGENILAALTYQDFDENLNKTDLSIENFRQVCPLLVYQLAADTSEERNGCILEPETADSKTMTRHHHTESSTKNDYGNALPTIWLYATISVIIISACGLLGVIIIPFMQKHFYHQLLQFLVALAIGTLCGDALLHLLPHAMLPHHHHQQHQHSSSSYSRYSSSDSASSAIPLSAASTSQTLQHNQNMWKGLVAMLGIIFFYFVEKFLTLGAEWRKRRQKKHKLPARVRVMRDNDSSIGQNSVGEKLCKHKYSSYPYCYDEIATETQDDHHNRGNNVAHKSGGCGNTPHNESSAHNNTNITTLGEYEELDVNNFQQKTLLNNHNKSTNETNQNELLSSADLPMLEMPNNTNTVPHKETNVTFENHFHNTAGELPSHGGHVLPVSEEESYTVILRAHESKHHGHSHAHGHVHSAPDSLSSVAWMVIMGDGLHNFTDGMAIGAAFASGIAGGFSTSVAVFCHELPHEIGDFAVLLKAGMSAKQAIFYNLLSSVLCFFGCLVGVAIGHSDSANEWVFAAAAGMFIYIALVDMIPELTSSHSKEGGSLLQCLLQFLGLMTGLGVMALIALYENDIKGMFGED